MRRRTIITLTAVAFGFALAFQPLAQALCYTTPQDRQGLAVSLVMLWTLLAFFWPRPNSVPQPH
jgi:hypothetical protein